MGKIKRVEDCKTYRDFESWGLRRGGTMKNSGRHPKMVGPGGGIVPMPKHSGDLPKGTRWSIIKMFKAVGLAVIVFAIVNHFM